MKMIYHIANSETFGLIFSDVVIMLSKRETFYLKSKPSPMSA